MNKHGKTLLLLSPGFPENEADSTCLPAQQSFILSVKRNFPSLNIVIIAMDYPFTSDPYSWHGIPVLPFNAWKKKKWRKLIIFIRIWTCIRRLDKKNNIIGVLCFWCSQASFVGKYFSILRRIPYFIWILGQDAKKQNKWVKWIRPNGQSLIAMSDFLAMEFLKNHKIRPAHIIPNGIDPSLFTPGNFERKIDVMGAGSLISLKQYDVFIDTIKRLTRQIPQLRSLICGKGPEEKYLREMIRNNNLENNIELCGELPHPDVLQLMQQSKVFLHPSGYEGFSGVCLEALYAGAHVVSFCNPASGWIRHWHIAESSEEMFQETLRILKEEHLHFKQILPFAIDQNAKDVLSLFRYHDSAIS